MENAHDLLLVLTFVAMIGALAVSIIPYIASPLIMWAIVLIFALLTQFSLLPVPAFLLLSLLAVIGTTTEYWMPLFGGRAAGMSCLGALGSLAGGIAGTLLIPIPILGSVIGLILGAMLIELLMRQNMRQALYAGGTALRVYVLGIIAEFITSLMMLLIFAITVFTNTPG